MAPELRSHSHAGTEISQRNVEDTPSSTEPGGVNTEPQGNDFLETLRRDIETRKTRNDLLSQAANEYRREFGDDLSKYPKHVADFVKIQKENEIDDQSESEIRQEIPSVVPTYRSRPTHMNPEPYKGKTSQERIEYIQACERVFDYSPIEYATDRSKIVWAATFLRKEPAKNWHRLRKNQPDELETLTWKKYIQFLDNLLLQPDARRLLISRKYESAQQGPKQSILSFVNYLEELETELEPYTETQKRDNLFNKIRPELQKKLVDGGLATRQNTREDLITSISLMDSSYLDKSEHSSKEKDSKKGKDKDSKEKSSFNKHRDYKNRFYKKRRWNKRGSDTPEKSQRSSSDSSNKSVICFNCNAPGHISPNCPKLEKHGEKRSRTNVAQSINRPGSQKKKLEITVQIITPKGKRSATALVDSGSDDDLISRPLAKAFGFKLESTPLGIVEGLQGDPGPIYGIISTEALITDSVGQQKPTKRQLYIVDMPGIDIILGIPWLKETNPVVDWATAQWRYHYDLNYDIVKPKKLEKILQHRTAYAIMPETLQRNADEVSTIPPEHHEYLDVFSEEKANELPAMSNKTHSIETNRQEPPYGPIYALSAKELEVLREYLDSSLEKGWIRKSTSPAGAPILFVPKKDGGLRLCVDYRGLNKITLKNRHPLPLIQEMLDRISGAKKLTKLDLRNAYHRIRIKAGDEWKTAFRTRYGHYEYQVMPFGLANAPATFQAYINEALVGLVDIICVVYLDDILIYSADPEDHPNHVNQVLQRLREHGLYVKPSKCVFHTDEVEFLGFVVNTKGIVMEPSRVETIRDWPVPTTFREVQVFLGFANFYRRFVREYSKIARPLTSMLRGSVKGKKYGEFKWGKEQQKAFDQLRIAFTTAPVLIHFDPSKPIRVETDASGVACGGVLSQPKEWPTIHGKKPEYRPVAYWSRKFTTAEMNYGTPDQELMAIVKCFQH